MGYSSFAQAKGFVESGYGDCNPVKTAEVVNTIRHHFYNWYQDLPLFLDAVNCFKLQTFFNDCNDCNDTFRGVTLPRDFQTVEAMWFNDWPVRLQSSWREFQIGIAPECACGLQKYDVPGNVCTALDIHPDRPSKLLVRAFDKADVGKKFLIRGEDTARRPFSQEFKLTTDSQKTEMALRSVNRAGGIIKDITAGRVVVMDEQDRLIGMYEPDETVPSYKRIKITGLSDTCDVVNIRANRRYFPLYSDDDVVETDNAPAFDAMARYLRLYRKADKSAMDLQVEKDHLATAFKMMLGEKSRDTGRATAAEVNFVTPKFGGSPRLNRLSGRRW